MKQEKCKVCGQFPKINCIWKQGRCPHLPPLIKGTVMNHRNVSLIKSTFRIVAGLALAGGGWLEMNPYIQAAGYILVFAEILGIAEELV